MLDDEIRMYPLDLGINSGVVVFDFLMLHLGNGARLSLGHNWA